MAKDKGKLLRRARSGRLVRAGETRPARTRAQVLKLADAVVDAVNRRLRKAGIEHEAIADYLLRELFDNDAQRALDPDREPTPEYGEVRGRAGRSLGMTAGDLAVHVRVGALNQLSRGGAWINLEWSKKRELLVLLGLDDGRRKFREGVAYANRPNVGVRLLREWVQAEAPRTGGRRGRPRGITLATGKSLLLVGVRLGNVLERARLAERFRAAPVEKRPQLMDDLRMTVANLTQLLQEIEQGRI